MARSDLLINLVKASTAGDKRLLRSTVEAMVAEERAKQHNILANRLLGALNGGASGVANGMPPQGDIEQKGGGFLAEIVPRRRMEDLILPSVVLLACHQLIEEQTRASLLRAHSLEPRHRVLLVGPPGNGKTSLAEAIAERLAVPYFVVRYEKMIGSYLGETAGRLKRVFDYARTTPCVLFFDEFDAIGKERGDLHETGEIKRVVASLLMQVDDLPSYTVVIAATNHAELLDRAAWRRFQLRLELPAPSSKELGVFLNRFLKWVGEPVGMKPQAIAERLGPISYSEAEQFGLDLLRRKILAMGERSAKVILIEQLKIWTGRVNNSNPMQNGLDRAGSTST